MPSRRWTRDKGATFVSTLADLLGDINALHPFREGTQRAFLAQLPATPATSRRAATRGPVTSTRSSPCARCSAPGRRGRGQGPSR